LEQANAKLHSSLVLLGRLDALDDDIVPWRDLLPTQSADTFGGLRANTTVGETSGTRLGGRLSPTGTATSA
jgi:hypothetical protein